MLNNFKHNTQLRLTMRISITTKTLFSIIAYTSLLQSADTINNLATVPDEVLTQIIMPAYIDYDDPKEFTELMLVSKKWYALIKSPSFKKDADALGFMEPMMVFHSIYDKNNNTTEIIHAQLKPENFISVSEKIKAYHKNHALFEPIELQTLSIDSPFSGIFTQIHKDIYPVDKDQKYIALWVNPAKTDVFNRTFHYDNKNAHSYINSRMKLSQYMEQNKRVNQLKINNKNNQLGIFKDPITAEPSLKDSSFDFSKSYEYPCIPIDAPIAPTRFVKKWPATYTFEMHTPEKKSVSGASYDMGCTIS